MGTAGDARKTIEQKATTEHRKVPWLVGIVNGRRLGLRALIIGTSSEVGPHIPLGNEVLGLSARHSHQLIRETGMEYF